MSPATRLYTDLCHLWRELVELPADDNKAARDRQELLDTVLSKLPKVKYFKTLEGAFIKTSSYPTGQDVLEILDMGGLSEGLAAYIILGTLAGWCASLQFVQLASAAEYYEALEVVLDAKPTVVLVERIGAC